MAHQHRRSWAERVLVERLASGDEAALGDLYDRCAGFVHGLALRTLADRQAAEDVTQEVFVALWSTGTHRPRAGHAPGLHRGDGAPAGGRRDPAGGSPRRLEARAARDDAVPDMTEAVIRSEMGERVRRALDHLPGAQRRALELAYFHGYTYRQVAEALDIPEERQVADAPGPGPHRPHPPTGGERTMDMNDDAPAGPRLDDLAAHPSTPTTPATTPRSPPTCGPTPRPPACRGAAVGRGRAGRRGHRRRGAGRRPPRPAWREARRRRSRPRRWPAPRRSRSTGWSWRTPCCCCAT